MTDAAEPQHWRIAEAAPVLVGGVARSGTTMLADVLNCHPTCAIQPEIPPKLIELFERFAGEIDDVYAGLDAQRGDVVSTEWRRWRGGLLNALFLAANKEGPLSADGPVTHFGVKTPSLEQFFAFFDRYYTAPRPYLVYCMRRPDRVWRSIKSIGWQTDFDRFFQRYRRSLSFAAGARARSPDRFVVFNLEAHRAAGDLLHVETVFQRLGLALTDDDRARISGLENRNSIVARGHAYVDDPNLEREMRALMADTVIRERWADLAGVELPAPAVA